MNDLALLSITIFIMCLSIPVWVSSAQPNWYSDKVECIETGFMKIELFNGVERTLTDSYICIIMIFLLTMYLTLIVPPLLFLNNYSDHDYAGAYEPYYDHTLGDCVRSALPNLGSKEL